MDADTGKFYFIEVNPRIQVEHTVTEQVTGIDIVKAQIRIIDGAAIGTPESGVPAQDEIRLNGHALQCRITTEDPENNFMPGLWAHHRLSRRGRLRHPPRRRHRLFGRGHHALLRSAAGQGHRLGADAAGSDRAHGPRAARVPHPRRRDQSHFLEAIINHPTFRDNRYTTRFIDTTPELFASGQAAGPRDQAAELSRRRQRQRPSRDARPAAAQAGRRRADPALSQRRDRRRHEAAARRSLARRVRRMDARRRTRCWSPTRPCATRTSRCSRPACARYDIAAHRRRLCARRCRSCCRWNAGAARPSTSPCAS